MGGAGGPRTSAALGCTLNPSPAQPISNATSPVLAFQPPISLASGGSGGGGGGDKLESIPIVSGQLQDDQGGGGGGGGGGVRITSIGPIVVTGSVLCNGAAGAPGNTAFAGGGGGGSGGQIWIQSAGSITMSGLSPLSVLPGTAAQACTSFMGGSGGAGVVQLEDSDGILALPSTSVNEFRLPFPYVDGMNGVLTSQFRDTGYVSPIFLEGSAVVQPGNLPGATATVRFQGARETLAGQPDLTSLSPEVEGSQLSELNGYRFIRYSIKLSYPFPPTSSPSSILPSIDEIRIRYSTPSCSAAAN